MPTLAERPARPRRPASVTVAFWLQVAAVLALLVMVGLTVAYAVYFDGQISRVAEMVPDADPDEVSAERTGNVVTSVVTGALILVVAVCLAATAVPMFRGSNVARIMVFVAAGAHILLCAAPCIGGAAVAPIFLASAPEEPYLGEEPWEESRFLETLYSESLPFEDGYFLGMAAGTGLELMLVIAVVVLLVVPPANRYFVPRPPAPAWAGGYVLPAGTLVPAQAYPPPAPWPAGPPWPRAPAGPHPGLTYVICPDPSAHLPPPPRDPSPIDEKQPAPDSEA
ncbi:hypothetical protein [Phytohabitans houttuyneae]|nr:hypothetical protein [Phytohabitans houttuyneae]